MNKSFANIRRSGAEMTCGIICGCIPVFPAFFKNLRPILKDILDKIVGSKRGAEKSEGYPSSPSAFNKNRPGSLVGGSLFLSGPFRHRNSLELNGLFAHSETRTNVGVGATRTESRDVESLEDCHYNQTNYAIPPNAIVKRVQLDQEVKISEVLTV